MISATIADCMTKDFAIITSDMLVVEASRELIKKAMLGGPVVDGNGQLVGWISEQECLQVTIQVVYHNQRIANVSDIMRTDVLSVTLHEDPLNLAQQMLQKKPKAYPVVDSHNKVIGVITRRHILNVMLKKMTELNKHA